ncbi:MAG: crossover junction endodeoxyribonuclease RuvC [Gammaproteobacteria bacterium]|nr:crossover junction endodeoxyribonuclease RuvC [Gammaproteobacteria bacterium]
MSIVLGIDPGSRVTGYGVIRTEHNRMDCLTAGTIRTGDGAAAERLRLIFRGLSEVIAAHGPDQAVVEKVFMHENPSSALKLGQARGVAIVAAGCADLPVFEYSATQIKQAVVGRGHADKKQVQHMVTILLQLQSRPVADAADALAAAICHINTQAGQQRIAAGHGMRFGRRR